MTTPDLRTAVAPALGHIVLRVRSVERSELFYCQVLGLHVRERRGDQMVFLTRGIQHHDIALFAAEDSAPSPGRGQIGLDHVAFKVPDFAALKAAYHRCKTSGLSIADVTWRGSSKSFHVRDPDGLRVELYCESKGGRRTDEMLRASLEC